MNRLNWILNSAVVGLMSLHQGAIAQEAPRGADGRPLLQDMQTQQILETIAARKAQRRSGGVFFTGKAFGESASCGENYAELIKERQYETIGDSTPASRLARAQIAKTCLELEKREILESSGALRDVRTYPIAKAFVESQYVEEDAQLAKILADETAKNNFRGMTFGVGAGFSRSKSIVSAGLAANGTVRVTEERKDEPRVILEAHYYGLCPSARCREGSFGIGPFFGIAPEADTINAFAIGLMFGFKDKQSQQSLSFGIGGVLDRTHQTLAPGFAEGQPLPAGETAPVLIKKSKWSPLVFVTKTF